MRHWIARSLVVSLFVAGVWAAAAAAYWSGAGVPGGSGRASIDTLGTGAKPTVTLAGNTATVTWAQTTVAGTLLGTRPSGGYTVRRYAESAPTTPIVPAATCNATVAGSANPLSCAEATVATGHWLYTIKPTLNLWVGIESPKSDRLTVPPGPPTSVTLTNGGGSGNAYVNSANASSLSFNVVLPASSLASDTVHLNVSDGTSAVSTSAAGITGGGTRSFTGVNVTTLKDATLTIGAWSTSSYNDMSTTTSTTRQKDTVRPQPVSVVTTRAGSITGQMQSGDAMEFTFSEPILATSVPAGTSITEINTLGSGNHNLDIPGLTNGPVTLGGAYIGNDNTSAAYGSSTLAVSGAKITATVGGSCTTGSSGGNGCSTLKPGSGALAFAPATTITDLAGNSVTGTFTTATNFQAF